MRRGARNIRLPTQREANIQKVNFFEIGGLPEVRKDIYETNHSMCYQKFVSHALQNVDEQENRSSIKYAIISSVVKSNYFLISIGKVP